MERPSIFNPSDEIRDLHLLEELERNPVISQRELSFNLQKLTNKNAE